MYKRKVRFSLIALALALVMALTACGGKQGGEAPSDQKAAAGPKKGGVLKVAVVGNPPTLDVHTSSAIIVENVTFNIFETLFALDSKFQPRPMLADSYEWQNENKKLVIQLRQGVLFHNDKEMTAEDAAASIRRWLKLSSLGKQLAAKVAAVQAVDKYTMAIELKAPSGTLLSALANPNNQPAIMPKEILDAAGDKPVSQFIGTGPYKLAEFAQDRYVRQVRWEKYRPRTEPADGFAGKKEAFLDEIQYIPVPEAQTREAGLQTGEYHYAFQIPQDHYNSLKGNPDLEMVITRPMAWASLVFNKKKGLFTDVRLRRAANWAIDPGPALLAAFGDKEFIRLDASMAPKETPFFGEFDNGQYNKRNLEKARALLKEANYDGTPVRLMTTKEYDFFYKYSTVAKQQLEEAGFKVDLQVVDWATLVQRRANPDLYDLFPTGFPFAPLPTAQNLFLSPAWPGWWENPQVLKLVERFDAELDPAKQKAHWDEVQKLFWEDLPVIHLGDWFNLDVKRKELKGFQQAAKVFFWNTWLDP